MSDTWSFSFADEGTGYGCYGRDERAVVLGGGAVETAELTGTGPFNLRGAGLGELSLEPLGPPISFDGAARREWICQGRGRSAGNAKLEGYGIVAQETDVLAGLALRRSLWICVAGKLAVSALAGRRSPSDPHGAEALEVHVARGTPLEAALVADPRLSSTYDGDGVLLRAGLELWEDEIEGERERGGALRLAGETLATGRLDGAALAFMRWHWREERGVGCYAIEAAG